MAKDSLYNSRNFEQFKGKTFVSEEMDGYRIAPKGTEGILISEGLGDSKEFAIQDLVGISPEDYEKLGKSVGKAISQYPEEWDMNTKIKRYLEEYIAIHLVEPAEGLRILAVYTDEATKEKKKCFHLTAVIDSVETGQ